MTTYLQSFSKDESDFWIAYDHIKDKAPNWIANAIKEAPKQRRLFIPGNPYAKNHIQHNLIEEVT